MKNIFLSGFIDSDGGGNYPMMFEDDPKVEFTKEGCFCREISLQNVQFIIGKIPEKEPINFVFTTFGGDLREAIAIYEYIKKIASEREIYGEVLGNCYSAGVPLICSIPKGRLKCAESTSFMTHRCTASGSGTFDDATLENLKLAMEHSNDRQAKIVSDYCEMDIEVFKSAYLAIGKDTYFKADEALKIGLISEYTNYNLGLPPVLDNQVIEAKATKDFFKKIKSFQIQAFGLKQNIKMETKTVVPIPKQEEHSEEVLASMLQKQISANEELVKEISTLKAQVAQFEVDKLELQQTFEAKLIIEKTKYDALLRENGIVSSEFADVVKTHEYQTSILAFAAKNNVMDWLDFDRIVALTNQFKRLLITDGQTYSLKGEENSKGSLENAITIFAKFNGVKPSQIRGNGVSKIENVTKVTTLAPSYDRETIRNQAQAKGFAVGTREYREYLEAHGHTFSM